MKPHYDLVIAGGGLIGLSLAAALRDSPLNVLLLEQQDATPAAMVSRDTRTTGLSISSMRFFQALELWSYIQEQACAIEYLHLTEQDNFGTARIKSSAYGCPAMGYMVPNAHLLQILSDRVNGQSNIEIKNGFKLAQLQQAESGYRLQARHQNGDVLDLQTGFLAVCDGAASRTRDLLGIGHQKKDYGQTAIISHIHVEKPMANTAFERFTQDGPLAVLPLGDDAYALVWTLATPQVGEYLILDDRRFIEALQLAFGFRLGRIMNVGQRASYPLNMVLADRLTAPSAVLLGNAAQALHPVAAQGFNLGLRDIQALVTLLKRENYSLDGLDNLLREYEQARRRDRKRIIRLTDGLTRVFGARGKIPRLVRSLGIGAIGSLPSLQKSFVRRNVGVAHLLME